MKRKFAKKRSLVLIVLVVAALGLASCTSPGRETPVTAEPEDNGNEETHNSETGGAQFDEDPMDMVMLGGSPTGVWFMVTTGISECVNKTYPGSVVQIIPGGGSGNPIRISQGEAESGMTHNILAYAAKSGADPYEDKLENIASIASFYSSCFQVVVDEDLGISTFDEIIENKMKIRLSIDKPGSSCQVLFLRMLEEYGVTVEEMEEWGCQIYFKNFADSSSMMSDGLVDGFGVNTLAPAPPIVETSLGKDMVLLEMNDEIVKTLHDKYGYSQYVVPAGTYDFCQVDINTAAATSILATSRDVSEEVAYKLARSIDENLDYMRNVHVALSSLTSESIVENLGVDLHPGAAKYYREQGIIE